MIISSPPGPDVQPEGDLVAHRARWAGTARPRARAAPPRAPGAGWWSGPRTRCSSPTSALAMAWRMPSARARLGVAEEVDRHAETLLTAEPLPPAARRSSQHRPRRILARMALAAAGPRQRLLHVVHRQHAEARRARRCRARPARCPRRPRRRRSRSGRSRRGSPRRGRPRRRSGPTRRSTWPPAAARRRRARRAPPRSPPASSNTCRAPSHEPLGQVLVEAADAAIA